MAVCPPLPRRSSLSLLAVALVLESASAQGSARLLGRDSPIGKAFAVGGNERLIDRWADQLSGRASLGERGDLRLERAEVSQLRDLTASLAPELPAARSPLLRSLDRGSQGEVLSATLAEIGRAAQSGQRPVVAFDLDGTLVSQDLNDAHAPQTAIPGAAEYVRALHGAGAIVVYLTARSVDFSKDTAAQLRGFGFPLDGTSAVLLPNPAKADQWINATLWKNAALKLVERLGKPVAYFENEVGIARMFQRYGKGAEVYRLNTVNTTEDLGGPSGVRVIDDYRGARR